VTWCRRLIAASASNTHVCGTITKNKRHFSSPLHLHNMHRRRPRHRRSAAFVEQERAGIYLGLIAPSPPEAQNERALNLRLAVSQAYHTEIRNAHKSVLAGAISPALLRNILLRALKNTFWEEIPLFGSSNKQNERDIYLHLVLAPAAPRQRQRTGNTSAPHSCHT
jgi:hypothetical protein